MGRTGARWRAVVVGASVALTLLPGPAGAQEPGPTVTTAAPDVEPASSVPNPTVVGPIPVTNGLRKRLLTTPLESLAEHGYVEQELFFNGRAGVHEADGDWGSDGEWDVTTEGTDAYRTRMLVRRPADPAAFNGTVVVSWLDVTGAFDGDEEWAAVGEELMRQGAAFVGVSAQAAGVSGPLGAVVWDPTRYGALHLANDALSYDVFSQAGQAINRLRADALHAYVRHGLVAGDGAVHLACRPADEGATYRGAGDHGAFGRLGEVACPVVIGVSDEPGPSAFAAAAAASLPAGALEHFPDLGHFGPLEAPQLVATAIRAFAAGL